MKTTRNVTVIPRIDSFISNNGDVIFRRNFHFCRKLLLFYSMFIETTHPSSTSPFADALLWARDYRKHSHPKTSKLFDIMEKKSKVLFAANISLNISPSLMDVYITGTIFNRLSTVLNILNS